MQIENIFNLIKTTANLSGNIYEYQIKISNGRFERENMIGVYKIRESIAVNNQNYKLAKEIHKLINCLESDSGIILKGVTINGKNYSGMYYLSEDLSKIVAYLED